MERSRNRPSLPSLLLWATGLWLIIVSLLLGSCGGTFKASELVGQGRGFLHGAEPFVRQMPLDQWADEYDARIEQCRAQQIATEEDREKCVGWTRKRVELASRVRDLYDASAHNLAELEQVLRELEQLKAELGGRWPSIEGGTTK